ncbi:MAG: hypothetical protein LBS80_05465 [Tannerella sp.]|jgi:hypothetical protein|nr:hypothetical protein [Tannerella sp.]
MQKVVLSERDKGKPVRYRPPEERSNLNPSQELFYQKTIVVNRPKRFFIENTIRVNRPKRFFIENTIRVNRFKRFFIENTIRVNRPKRFFIENTIIAKSPVSSLRGTKQSQSSKKSLRRNLLSILIEQRNEKIR